ncbi:MAG: restriction endonuclease subunit S [Hydrogenovibrio sp.]
MIDIGRLSEIAEVISGYAFKSQWFNSGDAKVIRIGDLQNERVKLDECFGIDSGKYKISEQFRVKQNDVLMALSGATTGKIAVCGKQDEGAYINQRVAIIRAKKNSYAPYIKYIFQERTLLKLLERAGGAAQPNLSPKKLLELEVPLPSLETQKQIAAILDRAEALKQKRQQALALADEYLRATFLDLFGDPITNPKGWNKKRLGDLTTVQTGSTPSRKNDSFWTNGHIPWVKTGEVFGKMIVDTDEKITDLAIENSNCKLFPKNTILLAMYGQGKTRGNVGLLGIEAATNQACAAILPCDELKTGFLFQYLKLQYERLRALGRGGNQENLNLSMVKDYELIIPPKPQQDKFEQLVKKVEALKAKMHTSQTEIDHLAKSLSQKAFRGEL